MATVLAASRVAAFSTSAADPRPHQIVQLEHDRSPGDPAGDGAVQMRPQAVGMDGVHFSGQLRQSPGAACRGGDFLAQGPQPRSAVVGRPQPETFGAAQCHVREAQGRPCLGETAGRGRQGQGDPTARRGVARGPRKLRSAPQICGDVETTRIRSAPDGSASGRAALPFIAPQSTTWSTGHHVHSGPCPPARPPAGTSPALHPPTRRASSRRAVAPGRRSSGSAAGRRLCDQARAHAPRRWPAGTAGPARSSAPWQAAMTSSVSVSEGADRVADQAVTPQLSRHEARRRTQLVTAPGHDVERPGHAPDPPLPRDRQGRGGGIERTGSRLVGNPIALFNDVEAVQKSSVATSGGIGRQASARTAANSPTRPIVVPRRSSRCLSQDSNLQ